MLNTPPVLTLPDSPHQALSIRAKAMLFHDPRSQALLQHIERIACSDATALIVGETGTGKELVARHIHQESGRRGPFVAVNCGAFSDNLIDAELFGHETGAYTGASGARAGWFEAAQGGTLFLDEIGDLSLHLQVKLLRILQERQVVRLGSRKPIPLDVRLIAATNIDLQKAVEAQNFRADLYYRLSVAPIDLPPLRERPGDILPLAQHFLSQYSARMKAGGVSLAEDAEEALLAYPWPGNIRELENVIHFALIVCRGDVVRAQDLKLVAAAYDVRSDVGAEAGPYLARSDGHATQSSEATRILEALGAQFTQLAQAGTPQLFQSIEAALVHAIYGHCRENQVQSARVLGITRNTLRTLLKRHGLLGADAGDTPNPPAPSISAAWR